MAADAGAKKQRNRFLLRTKENADFNQYWYSPRTIRAMADEVEASGGHAAFLSTPSVYFTVDKKIRETCKVFDGFGYHRHTRQYDTQWSKDAGYVRYDFNKPEEIPSELHHTFTMVVIDPPFITREVWDKYAEAANLLLVKPESVAESKAEATPAVESKAGEGKEASDGAAGAGDGAAALPAHRRLICSTIAENAVFMEEILGVKPVAFKPSIPNLVYQYNFYCNYTPTALGEKNPEIPDDD